MPSRRKFAKNAGDVRHFKLVSRSAYDAHADDPDAPPLVLEPFAKLGDMRRTGLTEAELTEVPEALAAKHPEAFAEEAAPRDPNENAESDEDEEDPEAALEGECYFPKDGYNYDQHLRRVTTGKKGGGGAGMVLEAPAKDSIPESVIKKQLAETQEQADLLRALEMVDEYEEMEEDIIEELMPGGVMDAKEMLWGPRSAEEADLPDLAEWKAMQTARKAMMLQQDGDSEGEEGLAGDVNLGGQGTAPAARAEDAAAFEDFMAEYDDDEIGGMEEEDIEGEAVLGDDILDEYLNDKQAENAMLRSLNEPIKGKYDDVPRATEQTKAIIQKHYKDVIDEEVDEDETIRGEESLHDDDESGTWDCESVLSTLSNVSNRPGKITRIKLIKKPPAMKSLKEENENSEDEEESEEEDVVELPDVVTERPANETAEEKRARKAGVKAMRKICRQMKKESKQTYKDEASKLQGRDVRSGDVKSKARVFKL